MGGWYQLVENENERERGNEENAAFDLARFLGFFLLRARIIGKNYPITESTTIVS